MSSIQIKRDLKAVFGICFGALVVVTIAVAAIYNSITATAEGAQTISMREIPRINIELNGITLEQLNSGDKKTNYYNNSLTVSLDSDISKYNDVTIRGRGNSTWGRPKSPYQIKFNERVDLNGTGATKKWIFLANYLDPTNLRNDLALHYAEIVGESNVVKGEFAELYINGEYVGLYYVCHKIEIDSKVIKLHDQNGILVEAENLHIEDSADGLVSENGSRFVISETVSDEEEDILTAGEDFINAYNFIEKAVAERDFETFIKYADLDSFVQYYLISEFTINPDAYCTSFHLYKNGTNDKIHAGPVWDFDYALANDQWVWGDEYRDNLDPYGLLFGSAPDQETTIQTLFFDLMKMPQFREYVNQYYRERILGRKNELLVYYDSRVRQIEKKAVRNNQVFNLGDFYENAFSLRKWLSTRYDFLDQTFGNNDIINTEIY